MTTQALLLEAKTQKPQSQEPQGEARKDLRKILRLLRRLGGGKGKRGRKGIETLTLVIIAVVVLAMAIAIAVMFYVRATGALSAVGTAQVSAAQIPNGLLVTVTAAGGSVTIQGIALYDSAGNNLISTCVLQSSTSNSTSFPQTLPNGGSVTFTFTGSSCSQVVEVAVQYNSGKVATASVG